MLQKVSAFNRLIECGVIAIIRKFPEEIVEKIAESLIEGGVTALEVTVDSPHAYRTIEKLSAKFQERAIVGAGTVIDSESAKRAIDSGAEFLFSPSLHKNVITTAKRYGKIVIPGVLTPTEIITAAEYGADIIKLFPATSLGPQYIKDLNGPFPHISIIPSGGINLDNIADYIKAGVVAVGVGSNLVGKCVSPVSINQGGSDRIIKNARLYVEAVKNARVFKS